MVKALFSISLFYLSDYWTLPEAQLSKVGYLIQIQNNQHCAGSRPELWADYTCLRWQEVLLWQCSYLSFIITLRSSIELTVVENKT